MIPATIGRYQVKKELGRGGMSIVYLAHDPISNRDVAIKVLPSELLHDGTFKARFEREAQAIARLEHSAIVTVYDYGESEGQPFLVMRWMAGGSLAERIHEQVFDLPEAIRIIATIAPALDEAHAKGMVHRDLKPENILFDARDEPCLADFGIVKLSEAGATLTGTAIVGTPAYMSPEQGRGERDVDGRSDIYSLGAILFEMLAGKLPYEADTPMGQIMKHITAPVPKLSAYRSDLPPAVQAVIERAMHKRRANRYASAAEMVQDLSRLLSGQAITDDDVPPTAVDTPMVSMPKLPSESRETDQSPQVAQRRRVIPQATPPPIAATRPKPAQKRRFAWVIILLIVLVGGGASLTIFLASKVMPTPEPSPTMAVAEFLPSKTLTLVIISPTSRPTALPTPTHTPSKVAFTATPTSKVADTATPTVMDNPGPVNFPLDALNLPDGIAPIGVENFRDLIKLSTSGQGAFGFVTLSSDGSVLAIATSTRIYFYNASDLSLLNEVPLQFPATEIAFSSDHRLIAAACQHDTVIWDWQQQQLLFTMTNPLFDVLNHVIFPPSGQYVVSGGNHTFVWNVADGKLVYTAENIPARAVDISQDGQYLAVPATNQIVQVLKLSDGSVVQELRSFGVTELHFSPDGEVLASVAPDANIVRLWKMSDWQEMGVLDGSTVVFSGDGKTLAVDHRKRQTINVWRYGASGAPDVPLGNYEYDRDGAVGVHLSSEGTYLAIWYTAQITDDPVGEKFTIKVTRVVDKKLIANLNTSKTWTSQVLTSPDENYLFSLSAQSVIQLWDILAGQNTASLGRSNQASDPSLGRASNAFPGSATEITSANGIMFAKIDGTNVAVSYATDNTPLRTIAADLAAKTDIAFTPDGQVLATISKGGTVRIWQVDNGKQVCVIGGVGNVAVLDNVERIFFSADGYTLATYQQDKTLSYWSANTCQLKASYPLQPYLLSSDQSLFVEWHGDLTFRKVDDGSALFTYVGPFTAPGFSNDGQFFFADLWDQTIHIWGIQP